MKPGISNRESASQEERERREHPPVDAGSPAPDGGDADERVLAGEVQTAHKAGTRSVAQKEGESRYADRSQPAARKVAGAFGAEPGGATPRDRAGSSHPSRGETPAERDAETQPPTRGRRRNQKRTTM